MRQKYLILFILFSTATIYGQEINPLEIRYMILPDSAYWNLNTDDGLNGQSEVNFLLEFDEPNPSSLVTKRDYCLAFTADCEPSCSTAWPTTLNALFYFHIENTSDITYDFFVESWEDDSAGNLHETCGTPPNDRTNQDDAGANIPINTNVPTGQWSTFEFELENNMSSASWKTTWRKERGGKSNPIVFGNIDRNAKKWNINYHSQAPDDADPSYGYSNEWTGNGHPPSPSGGDVTYTFINDIDQRIKISTDFPESEGDSRLFLYKGTTAGNNLEFIVSHDDTPTNLNATIEEVLEDGVYTLVVDSYGRAKFKLQIEARGKPCDPIIYVDQDNISGIETGHNWSKAFTELQDAIDLACECTEHDSTEIWVAEGTYLPTKKTLGTTDRHKAFHIQKNIKMFGGFNGNETERSQRDLRNIQTILSGDLNNNDDGSLHPNNLRDHVSRSDNAFHVMHIEAALEEITKACIIDGFFIERGNAVESSFSGSKGGGIYTNILENTDFDCIPTIRNCYLRHNSATQGGGIFVDATHGLLQPAITNCVFYKNGAFIGGGICNDGSEDNCYPLITNCTFTGNAVTGIGGAVANLGDFCITILINCILWDDSDNDTDGGNDEIRAPGLAQCILLNSIIDDGTVDGLVQVPDNIFSLDNLDGNPIFVNVPLGDLNVQNGSGAIDAGDNLWVNSSTNIDGRTRILGAKVDIGAYEFGLTDACQEQNVFIGPEDDINGGTWDFHSNQVFLAKNKIAGGNITFDGVQGAELSIGFSVEAGAVFSVLLDGCTTF